MNTNQTQNSVSIAQPDHFQEVDFVEPSDYHLELTHQRGQRLHGKSKRTVMVCKTKKRRSDRKRSKKITQKTKLQQREIKTKDRDLSVKKCADSDVINIKGHGYVHVSRSILNNTMFSDSEDEKFEDESWEDGSMLEPKVSSMNNLLSLINDLR
ncbi:hypothetical protein QKC54_gp0053 [Megavirus baoshan]|uniref:Uncharacterized protein n=1 Tax=Megavirus baoshan TaxID=2496520 RepID=A0A3S5HLF7_9VIRU|nr:hypothetical protein QKC54_gp0053 [Megavirus baoshan]AZL89851.1 hypothetical protein Mb1019 [Megavirus baoshan]